MQILRRGFWESFFEGPLAHRVLAGDDVASQEMEAEIARIGRNGSGGGVAIVGAGPGDPELLTFKALRCMQQADVIVYTGDNALLNGLAAVWIRLLSYLSYIY